MESLEGYEEIPVLRRVRDNYVESFKQLRMSRWEDVEDFARLLNVIKHRHASVVPQLVTGVRELREVFPDRYSVSTCDDFLNRFFASRIGTELLSSHYMSVYKGRKHGIVDPQCDPIPVVTQATEDAQMLCNAHYFGLSPCSDIRAATSDAAFDGEDSEALSHFEETWGDSASCSTSGKSISVGGQHAGHTGTSKFPYVPQYLYYILFEILKNSMRAVTERGIRRLLRLIAITAKSRQNHLGGFAAVPQVPGVKPEDAALLHSFLDETEGNIRLLFRALASIPSLKKNALLTWSQLALNDIPAVSSSEGSEDNLSTSEEIVLSADGIVTDNYSIQFSNSQQQQSKQTADFFAPLTTSEQVCVRNIVSRLSPLLRLPPVSIILSDDGEYVGVRISDQGGGIPRGVQDSIWSYSYTTAGSDAYEKFTLTGEQHAHRMEELKERDHQELDDERVAIFANPDGGDLSKTPTHLSSKIHKNGNSKHQKKENYQDHKNFFSFVQESDNESKKSNSNGNSSTALSSNSLSTPKVSPLAGFGCGLPLSRLYASYLGGNLKIVSLPGWGTDAHLVLHRVGTAEELTSANWSERMAVQKHQEEQLDHNLLWNTDKFKLGK